MIQVLLFLFMIIILIIIFFYQALKVKKLPLGYTTIRSDNGIEKFYANKANVKIYHWGEDRPNSSHHRDLRLSNPNWGVYGVIDIKDEKVLMVFNSLFDEVEEDREDNCYYLIVKKYGILIDSKDFQVFLSKIDEAIMAI